MGRGKFPSWLLLAVVVGLGELTYWLYNHYGFGVVTKSTLSLTFLTALVVAVLALARRMIRKGKNMTD